MRQLGKFLARRRLDPAEPGRPIGAINVGAVQEQQVVMDIQVPMTLASALRDYFLQA